MNKLKNLIEELDKIPQGKELSIRQQITLILWGLSIVLLPFLRFPFGVFQKLSLYPLLLIALLNIDKWWDLCWKNKYLRYTGVALAAYIGWQIISLPFSVSLNNIKFAENLYPSITETMTLGAWYVLLASCFLVPSAKIAKTFHRSLTITILYLCAYSIIEILHFAHVKWASDFLGKAIYFIQREVGLVHDWWPPVFWDSPRLRSVFAEPSFFAVIAVFALLYYGFCMWKAEHWKKATGNTLLMLLSALTAMGTRSSGAALSMIVSVTVFVILFAIFFCKLDKRQKKKGAILAIQLIFFTSIMIISQRGGIGDWQILFRKTHTKSSSSTRLIHLQAELKAIGISPIWGCGQGQYAKNMKEALQKSPEKTNEIHLWTDKEDYYPPRLNKYTSIALEYGIIGLLFFLMLFIMPFIGSIKSIGKKDPAQWIACVVLTCSMATICCGVATNNLYSLSLLVIAFHFFMNKPEAAVRDL